MPEPAPKRVLIVDDERDLVEPLALRLRAQGGLDVCVAYDGEEGMRQALASPPDAALIDLAMPEPDGWQLCRRLHEHARTRRTRLIVMTAWASKDLESRALKEGVAKVLLKPFEDAEMIAALKNALAAGPPAQGGTSP
jgi:DNA-binding response OmpR family regulator